MKSHVYRLMVTLCLCSLTAAVMLTACGGGEEAEEAQPPDENLTIRKEKMKEVSQLCGGINKVLKEGSIDNIVADTQALKALMDESAAIPPPFDTEKYLFYAKDFQARADTLLMAAETGMVDDTRPAFIRVTDTCGVCHYTCKFPMDL